MGDGKMHWVRSLGGPLMALPVELLSVWGGSDDCRSERPSPPPWQFDASGSPTDYDRACSLPGEIGVLTVGRGMGLVLSLETQSATWIPREGGGVLVRSVWLEDEMRLEDAVQGLGARDFAEPRLAWPVSGGIVRLFDSSHPGDDIATEFVDFELAPGQYAVSTKRLESAGIAKATLHLVTASEL